MMKRCLEILWYYWSLLSLKWMKVLQYNRHKRISKTVKVSTWCIERNWLIRARKIIASNMDLDSQHCRKVLLVIYDKYFLDLEVYTSDMLAVIKLAPEKIRNKYLEDLFHSVSARGRFQVGLLALSELSDSTPEFRSVDDMCKIVITSFLSNDLNYPNEVLGVLLSKIIADTQRKKDLRMEVIGSLIDCDWGKILKESYYIAYFLLSMMNNFSDREIKQPVKKILDKFLSDKWNYLNQSVRVANCLILGLPQTYRKKYHILVIDKMVNHLSRFEQGDVLSILQNYAVFRECVVNTIDEAMTYLPPQKRNQKLKEIIDVVLKASFCNGNELVLASQITKSLSTSNRKIWYKKILKQMVGEGKFNAACQLSVDAKISLSNVQTKELCDAYCKILREKTKTEETKCF